MANILLADDDAANLDLVRRALSADGHTVTTAADGAEALEVLEAAGGAIEVLVADIDMPALDGIALARAARQSQPQLKVVLMSGFAGQLDRARALDGAPIRTVSKPFSLEQIRAEVRAAIG